MTNTNTIFTVGIYCLDKMSNLNSMKIQQINLKFKKGSQPPNFSISPQKLIEAAKEPLKCLYTFQTYTLNVLSRKLK